MALVEVLMAMLVMGIGVVTLVTLFAISVRKTIRANQITHATILRLNAEAMTDTMPLLIFHPDGDTSTDHPDENYAVDPLGWSLITEVAPDPAFALVFGNDGTSTPLTSPPFLRRYSGGFDFNPELARLLVSLDDNWIEQARAAPANFDPLDPTFVELPAEIDLSEILVDEDVILDGLLANPGSPPPVGEDLNGNGRLEAIPSRIVLFDDTGRRSEAREISGIMGQQVHWKEIDWNGDSMIDGTEDRNGNGVQDLHPLPAGFTPQQVLIETKDRRFTWMLTVRHFTDAAAVSVVVFDGRPFDLASERIYQAAFVADSSTVIVDYTGAPKPFLKKGSYVLDAKNAHWYLIRDFNDDEGAQQVELLLRNRAADDSDSAILMRGIVDVYPLPLKSKP